MRRPAPRPTLFPYTTLFRSGPSGAASRAPTGQLTRTRAHSDGTGRSAAGREVLLALRGSEEHTSELQSPYELVCRLLLAKKKASNRSDRSTFSTLPTVPVAR